MLYKNKFILRSACTRCRTATLGCLLLLPALLSSGAARAELKLTEMASLQFEHSSDVFDLGAGAPVQNITGRRSDDFFSYGGGLDVDERWSRQHFIFDIAGSDYRYGHFTQLNHQEYKIGAQLDWNLLTDLSGSLEVARKRSLVPYIYLTPAEQNELQLPVQTDQRETARAALMITPLWRVLGSIQYDDTAEPLLNSPNLRVYETSGTAGVNYLGITGLTSGISAGYLSGIYVGDVFSDNPTYKQSNIDLVATYQPTGRSTLSAEVGYSKRTSSNVGTSLSGVTGNIDFKSSLTAKTSVDLKLSRLISNYIANTGSEIDTIASLYVRWQATYKLTTEVGYSYTYRGLPDQGNSPDTDRNDRLNYVSFDVNYDVMRYVSIKPYINYQTRRSSLELANFNTTTFGVYLTFKHTN